MKPTKREVVLACFVFVCGFLVIKLAMEPRLDYRDRVSCYSNLKRIGLALAMYTQDNDQTLPRAWFGRNAGLSDSTANYKWMDAVFPYIKQQEVFSCPRDKISKSYRYRSADNYGSYSMNNSYFAPGDKQTSPAGLPLSSIESPANTVCITDSENTFQFAWPDAARTPPMINVRPFQLGSIRGRHSTQRKATGYGEALALNCDFSASTATLHYERHTRIINGKLIYLYLTVEDDGQ